MERKRGWGQDGERRDGYERDPNLKSCKLTQGILQDRAPESSQGVLKQSVCPWDQPCLSTYPDFSERKRRCGRKLNFHGVESHRAGLCFKLRAPAGFEHAQTLSLNCQPRGVNPRLQAARGGAACSLHSVSPKDTIPGRYAKGLSLGLWNCK